MMYQLGSVLAALSADTCEYFSQRHFSVSTIFNTDNNLSLKKKKKLRKDELHQRTESHDPIECWISVMSRLYSLLHLWL